MRKHFLTILVGISISLIFLHYVFFITEKKILQINSFSLLLNTENNSIIGKSSLPLKEIFLFSSEKILPYKIHFINENNFYIDFFDIPEEGWTSSIYLKCISQKSTLTKKIFLSLEGNKSTIKFFIKSFSPTYSKKLGNPSLEIQVIQTGNLQGISLQIESPKSYRSKYLLPELTMNEGEIWKIIFPFLKGEDLNKIIIDKQKKEIKIPFKISDTVGAFSFIRENNQEIEDFLIYSNKKEDIEAESILKSIKINLETIKNKKGFPFKEILSENIIRTYKSKVGATKKIMRKNPNKPFEEENSYIISR